MGDLSVLSALCSSQLRQMHDHIHTSKKKGERGGGAEGNEEHRAVAFSLALISNFSCRELAEATLYDSWRRVVTGIPCL